MAHRQSSAANQQASNQNFIDFRKRRSYTLEEKLEIIKELESGAKQAQVAESKRIAASTVQNIWSTRDRVLRDYRRVRNHSLRKIPRNPRSSSSAVSSAIGAGNYSSTAEYADIDKALIQWYMARRNRNGGGLGTTGPILKAKAIQISKQFGHYDFKASAGWFSKWVVKYGVTIPKISEDNEVTVFNGNGGNSNNMTNSGDHDAVMETDDDVGLWPVTVTYGNSEEEEEEQGEEVEDEDILDASAFLIQNHQEQQETLSYQIQPVEPNKPIKEMRNGVEVIYRTRGSKGGRYKSYIWKYFREQEEEVDGGTLRYVECVFCNNRVSPKAGRMEKHLQSCEFCPPEIIQNELALGHVSDFKPAAHRSLHNIITSSRMDNMNEENGEIETDIIEEDMIEDEDGGNQSSNQSGNGGQDQEASSSSCAPASSLKKRRTFHWKRIATYKNVDEAELALGDLSMWSRKHKHRTQQGIKTYYGCKFGRHCPVQMHLLFETRTKRVIMFQTMEEHCHVFKLKKRGLPQEAEKPIRQLYNEGVTKPSHIQQALDEEGGIEVPPRYQIAYFLEKIKREETGSISAPSDSGSPIKGETSETITIPGCAQDLMNGWYDEGNDEDSGGIEILPFFRNDENADVEDISQEDDSITNWTEFPVEVETSTANSQSASNLFKSAIKLSPSMQTGETIKNSRDDFSIYPTTTGQSGNGLSTMTVTEVPISISSTFSQSQFCTFRDETTKDGDILVPGEVNVKRSVINFIEKNFSNRDFLQIHRELQSLKDAQKFTSLIRLASFTAGFLQTAFLDQQQDIK